MNQFILASTNDHKALEFKELFGDVIGTVVLSELDLWRAFRSQRLFDEKAPRESLIYSECVMSRKINDPSMEKVRV